MSLLRSEYLGSHLSPGSSDHRHWAFFLSVLRQGCQHWVLSGPSHLQAGGHGPAALVSLLGFRILTSSMNYSFKTARSKAHLYSWDGSLSHTEHAHCGQAGSTLPEVICVSLGLTLLEVSGAFKTAECNQMGIEVSVDQSSTVNWSSPQSAVTGLGTCMLHLYLKVLWMLQNTFASLACRSALLWVNLLQTQVQKVSLFSSKGRC